MGGLADLAHRFVEGLLELVLEAATHASQFAVDAADSTDGLGQLLGSENDQGQEQDDDDLASRQIEHTRSLGIDALVHRSEIDVPVSDHLCQHDLVQQRLPSRIDPPIGFAHRGARAHAPENTIEAFRLARRLGATGLESDVWVTRDGQAVLDHDGVVRRRGRKIAIRDVDRKALPSHVPSVAELLDSIGGDFEFSVDVKDPSAIDALLREVRHSGTGIEQRLWICHPEFDVVAGWRRLTHARLVDSTRLARIKEGPERRAARLREAAVDAINMHFTDWNGGLVTLFHRFDRFALGWDLQHDEALINCLRMGLDGVFSDWTDRMMQAVEEVAGGDSTARGFPKD